MKRSNPFWIISIFLRAFASDPSLPNGKNTRGLLSETQTDSSVKIHPSLDPVFIEKNSSGQLDARSLFGLFGRQTCENNCGNGCCKSSEKCCPSSCCPDLQGPCCDTGGCCPSYAFCFPSTDKCCSKTSETCGGKLCLVTGSVCCGSGTWGCCPSGTECGNVYGECQVRRTSQRTSTQTSSSSSSSSTVPPSLTTPKIQTPKIPTTTAAGSATSSECKHVSATGIPQPTSSNLPVMEFVYISPIVAPDIPINICLGIRHKLGRSAQEIVLTLVTTNAVHANEAADHAAEDAAKYRDNNIKPDDHFIVRVSNLDCSTVQPADLQSCQNGGASTLQTRAESLVSGSETTVRRTLDNKTTVVIAAFGDLDGMGYEAKARMSTGRLTQARVVDSDGDEITAMGEDNLNSLYSDDGLSIKWAFDDYVGGVGFIGETQSTSVNLTWDLQSDASGSSSDSESVASRFSFSFVSQLYVAAWFGLLMLFDLAY
ncbi:hypothetical protein K456DRAFT_36941 [Colletotrichum gloeosporioides 23]|nr:hypothetical protein K456DRAFT_36941 [Colletotrichum gloeosporioides 23]